MAGRIWRYIGDIKVSFFLLMATSLTLFIGSLYANKNYLLFRELNRMRVQDWLVSHIGTDPEKIWWVPVLFVIMGFLGLNTSICAFNRLSRLFGQRKALRHKTFFYLTIPSIIHCLFMVIMMGHLLTFTLGRWETLPIEEGLELFFADMSTRLKIKEINDTFYPNESGMKDRIIQTVVEMEPVGHPTKNIQYVKPVFVDGNFLFLDKKKKRKKDSSLVKELPGESKETCNKAPVFVEKNNNKKEGSLFLLKVSDPGLPFIISGLFFILCLMLWYYLAVNKEGNRI